MGRASSPLSPSFPYAPGNAPARHRSPLRDRGPSHRSSYLDPPHPVHIPAGPSTRNTSGPPGSTSIRPCTVRSVQVHRERHGRCPVPRSHRTCDSPRITWAVPAPLPHGLHLCVHPSLGSLPSHPNTLHSIAALGDPIRAPRSLVVVPGFTVTARGPRDRSSVRARTPP